MELFVTRMVRDSRQSKIKVGCYGCNTNRKYSPDGILLDGILPTAPVKIYHSIDTPTGFPPILKVHVAPIALNDKPTTKYSEARHSAPH